MNVKKFLKKNAQEDLQAISSDKDQQTLQELQSRVVETAPKNRRNLNWLWAVASGALACAVGAILLVELLPSSNNELGDGDAEGVKYDEVIKQEASNLSELSEALTHLTLNFAENQEVKITKTFDLITGNALYYVLTIDEESMEATYSLRLMIVVNDDYKYDNFDIKEDFVTETYADYSVIYKQEMDTDPDLGLNMIECKAKIENPKYEMYVLEYQEYSFDDGTFLTVINNLLDFNK